MGIFSRFGKLTGIYSEDIEIKEMFYDIADRFADLPGTVCLLSGGDLDCAKFNILGVRPVFTFEGRGKDMAFYFSDETVKFKADPLDTLRFILDYFKTGVSYEDMPFTSGLLGYLAYDLKDDIEKLPRTSIDDLCLPSIWLTLPSIVLVQELDSGRTRMFIPETENDEPEKTAITRDWFFSVLSEERAYKKETSGAVYPGSNFEKSSYMDAIEKIKKYICSGDIYQVNMSQRFNMEFKDRPYSLFKDLFRRNPAPFFAYINAGDHQIVSTSPERFILKKGNMLEARPIKGTRPRGKTAEKDEHFKNELVSSMKDDAELSMIVDLMRNDLGRVCKGGSVRVKEHKRVEAYANVFHLISVVEGELDRDMDCVDIIRATFPGGSITGCPKIRSMEIIDELETVRRHIYTGSIGYFCFDGSMDLSIAIRTATVLNNRLVFSVGGGVVYDSDPLDEYNETLHKGRTFFEALSGGMASESSSTAQKQQTAWINGAMMSVDEINMPLMSPAVQYGHGFFETLLVDRGRIFFLDDHLERIYTSCRTFFGRSMPDLSFDLIIKNVIESNNLENSTAAVKIMIGKGTRSTAPFDDIVSVTARPYIHRLDAIKKNGIDLGLHTTPRYSLMASHKSVNYQFYFHAGEKALENGFDEALILNVDGSVSETNTANILFLKGRTLFCPVSEYVLQGIMEKNVRRFLVSEGYEVCDKKIFPFGLDRWDCVFLTNSLMGAVPVRSFEGMPLKDSSFFCDEVNKKLSGR